MSLIELAQLKEGRSPLVHSACCKTMSSEHDAVESLLVRNTANDTKAEATTVLVRGFGKITDRSGDSKLRRHAGEQQELRGIQAVI